MKLSKEQKVGLAGITTALCAELAAVAFWSSSSIADEPIQCDKGDEYAVCVLDSEQARNQDQIPELAVGAVAIIGMAVAGGEMICLATGKNGAFKRNKNPQTQNLLAESVVVGDAMLTHDERSAFDEIARNIQNDQY